MKFRLFYFDKNSKGVGTQEEYNSQEKLDRKRIKNFNINWELIELFYHLTVDTEPKYMIISPNAPNTALQYKFLEDYGGDGEYGGEWSHFLNTDPTKTLYVCNYWREKLGIVSDFWVGFTNEE